jgi:hypothetical protein
MNRRHFLYAAAATSGGLFGEVRIDVAAIDRVRILKSAQACLGLAPVTVTAASSLRSAGGLHDYFSEADYWWPDPNNPKGPYIQRDGMTNPGNFIAHRHALMQLSLYVPALAAAWKITKERRYAGDAARHLRAWFLDPATLMNPHLLYAQAIQGRATGRGTGIIDTLHLVEVARAISVLEPSGVMSARDISGLRKWFAEYLTWMTTHRYGIDERDATNNHATCWVAQVAEFARLTGSQELTRSCRDRYTSVLLPTQMAVDGSYPLELKRTKPYGYSLFNLDAMATVCQILTTPEDSLWRYELPDGRGMRKAMAFMFPFIADKEKWPYPPDVMYFDQWPVRHPSLLFAGLVFNQPEYIDLWHRLNPNPIVEEAIRNYPIRQPVLWLQ